MQVDMPTLVNWAFFYLVIPLLVSIGATFATYSIQRKRDDVAWQREKEKLQQEFQYRIEAQVRESKLQLQADQERRLRSEILPRTWTMLKQALESIIHATADKKPVYNLMPLSKMTTTDLVEFLNTSGLNEQQKQRVLEADDKTASYRKSITINALMEAKKVTSDFQDFILTNRIYFDDILFAKLSHVNDWFSNVVVDSALAQVYDNDLMMVQARETFLMQISPMFPEIEKLMKERIND